ncbi:MAG: methyltransferase domain-containing protein [bacterium]
MPFHKFNGITTQYPNEHFEVVLSTNVLHHSAKNQKAEAEIRRILKPGGSFVVIETVPIGDHPQDLAVSFERTFVGDYFYNRILHPGANVPVPGTYETPSGWTKRFTRWSRMVFSQDLGIDIPVIQDSHWLGVFTKK